MFRDSFWVSNHHFFFSSISKLCSWSAHSFLQTWVEGSIEIWYVVGSPQKRPIRKTRGMFGTVLLCSFNKRLISTTNSICYNLDLLTRPINTFDLQCNVWINCRIGVSRSQISIWCYMVFDAEKAVLWITVVPLLWGHPDERPLPLERPLDYVNLNINVLISTPDERPPLLKGHFSDAKGVASQEGFHCNQSIRTGLKVHGQERREDAIEINWDF